MIVFTAAGSQSHKFHFQMMIAISSVIAQKSQLSFKVHKVKKENKVNKEKKVM